MRRVAWGLAALLVGCAPPDTAPVDEGPVACTATETAAADGSCCPAGTAPGDVGCLAAGVPPASCGEGFAWFEGSCYALVPDEACADEVRADEVRAD